MKDELYWDLRITFPEEMRYHSAQRLTFDVIVVALTKEEAVNKTREAFGEIVTITPPTGVPLTRADVDKWGVLPFRDFYIDRNGNMSTSLSPCVDTHHEQRPLKVPKDVGRV